MTKRDKIMIAEALSIAITTKRMRADEKDTPPATARRFDREADEMNDLLTRFTEEKVA